VNITGIIKSLSFIMRSIACMLFARNRTTLRQSLHRRWIQWCWYVG